MNTNNTTYKEITNPHFKYCTVTSICLLHTNFQKYYKNPRSLPSKSDLFNTKPYFCQAKMYFKVTGQPPTNTKETKSDFSLFSNETAKIIRKKN